MVDKELDKEILLFVTKGQDRFFSGRTNKNVLKRRGYYDYLKQRYDDNLTDSIAETLYRMFKNIESVPTCRVCGGKLRFKGLFYGYSTFCSKKCSNDDPIVKDKIRKAVSTAKRKSFEDPIIKKQAQDKRAKTLHDKYGCDSSSGSPFSMQCFQDRAKETLLKKYGVDNIFRLSESHEKSAQFQKDKAVALWKSRGYDIVIKEETVIIKNGCPIHGDVELRKRDFHNRMKKERRNSSPICNICNPISYNSGQEVMIYRILDELGIEYETHDRKIIKPYEIDIVCKDNICIEVDGIFWHSDKNKPVNYHIMKTDMCLENGYKLIHILESDISRHYDKVYSVIASIFEKYKRTIFLGDEYTIKELDKDICSDFINRNYIYSSDVKFDYAYGLYFDGELISVMSFKNKLLVELTCYCNLLHTDVIDSFDVLLNYFLKHNRFLTLIAKICRDYFIHDKYLEHGFYVVGMDDEDFVKIDNSKNAMVDEEERLHFDIQRSGKVILRHYA